MNSFHSRSQNHEVAKDGKDLCKSSGPNPLFKPPVKTVLQDSFENLQGGRHHNLPGMFSQSFLLSQLCPLPLVLSWGSTEKTLTVLFLLPFQVFTDIRPPATSTRLNSPSSVSLSSEGRCSLTNMPLSACTRGPKTGHSTPGTPMLRKREESHPLTCSRHSS